MKAASVPRWAMSFADIALLLLGFFILLHVNQSEKSRVADSVRGAFGAKPADASERFDAAAARLFEPGEARLIPAARKRLQAIGATAARAGKRVEIESLGKDPASHRFDGWELAAARVAAAARAVEQGGLAERRITIAMPSARNEARADRHRVLVQIRP